MAPVPQPMDVVQDAMAGYQLLGNDGNPRPNSISLAALIKNIVVRSYNDLTVLAELLPRKTDMERKMDIHEFSERTRQLFIGLLGLVKWAASVSKVDKSANIISFLDKQNMLFVETADMLFRMSNETLLRMRMPSFDMHAAIEILSTGMYNRVPLIIRQRLLPPEPITFHEKKQTLARLNQIIQYRLVTSTLPPQMKDFTIKNGRVIFEVKNEFSISLTLMNDSPTVSWRLLEVDILVEDKETGEGKSLVHWQQRNYLHMLMQVRLNEHPDALKDVYNSLHFFCQSLQLDVCYAQMLRLMRDRGLNADIEVDEYDPGVKMVVNYWLELVNMDKNSELEFRLIIKSDFMENSRRCLAVIHVPSLSAKEAAEVAEHSVLTENISMERLLVHTIYIRTVTRLNDLKVQFQSFLKDVDLNIQGTPAILTVPVLTPCLRAEQIHITIDTYSGLFRCNVPKHLDCSLMNELQDVLNGDHSKLEQLIKELRLWITHRRCEKTLQHLPATAVSSLPFLSTPDDPIMKRGRHRIFVKLHRHPNEVLVVHLKEKEDTPNEIDYTFYMGSLSYHLNEADQLPEETLRQMAMPQAQTTSFIAEVPRMYCKLEKLEELDSYVCTHGPGTDLEDMGPRKRKCVTEAATPCKQPKTIFPAYFIPELAHVVAMCDERLPFRCLEKELIKQGISHSGVQVESNGTSWVLKLLNLPKPSARSLDLRIPLQLDARGQPMQPLHMPVVEQHIWQDLQKRLLAVCMRSQMNKNNQIRSWVVELVFYNTPLQSVHEKEQGYRRTVYLSYEQTNQDTAKTVQELLKDWARIVYLYGLVYNFADEYNNARSNLCDIVSIKSYNYMNLLLGYGPKKEVTCKIYWCSQANGFRIILLGGISAVNAHSLMREQLTKQLNRCYDLAQIVKNLHETYNPLCSLAKLPIVPHLGVMRQQVPVLSFCLVANSCTVIRLIYQAMYCLEIVLKDRFVSIRDAVHEEFTLIQGLKNFLLKYVDEAGSYRGQNPGEDENPPSPIGMEDSFSGPSSMQGSGAGGSSPFLGVGMRGPQSPRDSGLRFSAPHTPPSSSNPHTPASPHPSAVVGPGVPGHPSYNLTSPPAPHMPHPSPGALMPSSPLNPQPSPHMVHSPGPNALYMPSHQDSPFMAMSPATSTWPGSPGMPRPSPRPGQSPERMAAGGMLRLPANRPWAASLPTVITEEAFDTLCRPSTHPIREIGAPDMSALERFLGCVYMRHFLLRHVKTEDTLSMIKGPPHLVLFKVDNLQCQVSLNQLHMQSLHLKVTQIPTQVTPDGKQPYQLSPDDLLVIEQYFDTRVVVPPYRQNNLIAFCRLLNCNTQILKDFVQIMRLEMKPELGGDQFKWSVQWCLRVPPSVSLVPVGNPGLVAIRNKFLFFFQITRLPLMGRDGPLIVIPLVYDLHNNSTQLAERREQMPSQITTAVSGLLRRFGDFNSMGQCTIFPAVREILMHLQLPIDGPQPMNPSTMLSQVMNPQVAGVVGMPPQMGPVGPVYSQMGQPQMSQLPMSQQQMNQAQMNQAQMNQAQMNQAQMNPSQMNQPQMLQTQMGQPQMGQPQMGQPQMGQPQIGPPQMLQPQMGQPQMGQPQMGQPQMGQPQMGQQQMVSPQMMQTQMVQSQLGQPQMVQPQMLQTQMGQHQMMQSQMGQPQMMQPQMLQQQMMQPQLGQPQMGQPQMGQPQMGQPQMGQSQMGQPQMGQPQMGQQQMPQ